MKFQQLLTLVALSTTVAASPLPIISRAQAPVTPNCPGDYCAGTANNKTLIHDYICGDPRLGPERYPAKLPLSDLVNTYDPLGGLCPGAFLAKWYDATAGSYIYPPDSGFQLNTAGAPIEGTVALPVGTVIDRFGSEFGSFVSPAGAPYSQRALPPSNLDTNPSAPNYPYNYHVYKVIKSFDVLSGPIAGWFGQPGQGVQYQLSSNIMTLLSGGFIERVTLD